MRLRRGFLEVIARDTPPTHTEAVRWAASGDLWQGLCGLAVRERAPVWRDLGRYQGKAYEDILDLEDKQPRWGMTRVHWERTRDLGSIVSVPILYRDTVLGVVNVDSRARLAGGLVPRA